MDILAQRYYSNYIAKTYPKSNLSIKIIAVGFFEINIRAIW